ncbi:hypothetical protein RZS08_00715, partial [Arthrospira platensis SPKY1]|nr:hypothetical protein [Arthrospira platensis SPKY1]
ATVAANQAATLEAQMNSLLKRERDLKLARAEANTEIEKQKLIAEDVTKSVEERIAATEKAASLEKSLLDQEIALQKERLDLIKAKNAITKSGEADVQAEYDAAVQ